MSNNQNLPTGWTTINRSNNSARYQNKKRGLEVSIKAVKRGSKSRRRRKVLYHVVELKQDWFSRGTLGDRKTSAKVETFEEGIDVAHKFMGEFTTEMESQPENEIAAAHRSTDSHEEADQTLISEAAAEALADAAGYSDELLLDILDNETNGEYVGVVHRDGNTIEPVGGLTEEQVEEIGLKTIFATFPVDNMGVEELFDTNLPFTTLLHINEYAVYRFIFNDAKETVITLMEGTQVSSPSFEHSLRNVLEEKW